MQITIEINANLLWRVGPDGDSGKLLAVCDALGVTAAGTDEAELKSAIETMLDVTFCDLLETGDLGRFLESKGWTPRVPLKKNLKPQNVRFQVPWQLIDAKSPSPAGEPRRSRQ